MNRYAERETFLSECEVESINTLMDKQSKGAEKYGHGIHYEDTNYDWIEECIEELSDGLQYAVAAKMRRELYSGAIIIMLDSLDIKNEDIRVIDDIKEMLELI